MAAVVYYLSPILVKGLVSLVFMIFLGAVVYFLTVFILAKNEVVADIRLVLNNLKK